MNGILMVHANGAMIKDGVLTVDRKFHVGMELNSRRIHSPLITVNPHPNGPIMDPVSVPVAALPYRIEILGKVGVSLTPQELPRMRELVKQASLVYAMNADANRIAKELGVPYILVLEYDLATQINLAGKVKNPIRKAVRVAKCVLDYYRRQVPEIRAAAAVHCNGYPTYEAIKDLNDNRLLYLDSRITADALVTDEEIDARQGMRLLYSGRYEPMKGAVDAVRVAAVCLDRGLPIEMHCYGQGSLKGEMEAIAKRYAGKIFIHDAIPYPELVEVSKGFNLFVCCHVQNDPSCTYLESLGLGLPIVGYDNLMWRYLRRECQAGFGAPIGDYEGLAEKVAAFVNDPSMRIAMSKQAVRFARMHAFEVETQKRIDALNAAVSPSVRARAMTPLGGG